MNELEEITRRVRPLKTVWLAMIAGVVAGTVVVILLIRAAVITPIPALRAGSGAVIAIILVLALASARYVRKFVEKTPPSATRSQVAEKWQKGWLVGQTIKEGNYRLRAGHPQFATEVRQIHVIGGNTAEIRVRLSPRVARPATPPPPPPGTAKTTPPPNPIEEGVTAVKKIFGQ